MSHHAERPVTAFIVDHVRLRPCATAAPRRRWGKVRPVILAWALGVPIPIILIVLLIRGCM